MSNGSRDKEELLRLGKMCRELRKEKDVLQVSLSREQSINAELIRRTKIQLLVDNVFMRRCTYSPELRAGALSWLYKLGPRIDIAKDLWTLCKHTTSEK